MAKPKQTSQKSDREKKKKRKQQEKEEKRELRKTTSNKGKGFDSMIAYMDHNGHITDTPPDPKLKVEVKLEDIIIGPRSFIKKLKVTLNQDELPYLTPIEISVLLKIVYRNKKYFFTPQKRTSKYTKETLLTSN